MVGVKDTGPEGSEELGTHNALAIRYTLTQH